MKRALTLSLILLAACASKDGFIENNKTCESGSEVGIQVGWDTQASAMESGTNRMTMMVEVSNNTHGDITVNRVFVDPMAMQDDSPWVLERGAVDADKVIAEGDAATFEVPMMVRRPMVDARRTRSVTSSVDVAVTVLLEPEATYRCRFRVPMGF